MVGGLIISALIKKGKVQWRDEIHSQPRIEGQAEYLPAKADWRLFTTITRRLKIL